MNLEKIVSNQVSLPDLSAEAPGLWQEVLSELKSRVHSGQSASLAELRRSSLESLNSWQNASNNSASLDPRNRDLVLKAKLTVLAIDQWADVMAGKAGRRASVRDRVIMSQWLLPKLVGGRTFSTKSFDRIWRWVKDPLWAAAELQRNSYWSVPTVDFCERMAAQAQGRGVLELGAGRGLLYRGLLDIGVAISAVDDGSWKTEGAPHVSGIEVLDAVSALKQKKPVVVIASWPPPDNAFEADIFKTPSVQLYLAIVSKHRFASGNWQTYQAQRQFACSSSEPLNQLLRPLEAEQQVLIFRRR